MKSYYQDMAKLIDKAYDKPRVGFSSLSSYEPLRFTSKKPSLIERIKDFFKKKEEPTPVPIAEIPSDYNLKSDRITTLTSFCGADLVVMVGSKAVGELQTIRWYKPSAAFLEQLEHSDYYDKELAMKRPVVILTKMVVFDKDAIKELNDADIIMTFANEYGQSAFRAIYNVSNVYEIGGTDIDDVVSEGYMILSAETVTELKPSVQCTESKNMEVLLDKLQYKVRSKTNE